MRFIFFTKTDWSEPPRLRHQLARLLVDAGYEVIFFQRPYYPWQRIGMDHSGHNRIILYRYRQLIHHKLRLHPLLHSMNALFVKRQIASFATQLKIVNNDVIVNFNYDYYFIRKLFPKNRIITIINDDFWSRALGGYQAPLKWALRGTVIESNKVLTVSVPLQKELLKIGHADIFYPWADSEYNPPDVLTEKSTILYWGYINDRIDFEYIANLSRALTDSGSELKIVFVGPVQCSDHSLGKIVGMKNIEVRTSADLNDIDFTEIFSAFIPYRSGVSSIDVITFPNKALRLLANGLPICITGMPDFIDESFVFRLPQDPLGAVQVLDKIRVSFSKLQPGIQSFVRNNGSELRLHQFIGYL